MGEREETKKKWPLAPSFQCLRQCGFTGGSGTHWGFPGGSDGKESAYDTGDLGLIPGSGRSPGEGNSNLFRYSCLENPMDRETWQATVRRVTKIWIRLK